MSQICEAISTIRKKINKAQEISSLAEKEILLLAVTKTIGIPQIEEAVACGLTTLGENRVQELLSKYDQIKVPVDWHLIGHLQTNKVKYIIDKVSLIHSLDSLALAREIDKRSGEKNQVTPVLVQINVADEDSKFGLAPAAVEDFIKEAAMTYPNIAIKGLMTIGPYVEDPEEARPVFQEMRNIRDRVRELGIPQVEMKYLSMGMTNDYQIAVEEGANIVRVGSGIFGTRR